MTDERQFPEGSRVNNLELTGVHLHGVELEGARLTDANFRNAQISGEIDGLRINDVEVDLLVQSELDRRFPERLFLRSADLADLRQGWLLLEGFWSATTERASRLPVGLQVRRVDGEWSFVETLRHLIFATDCWLSRGVELVSRPYHSWGIPWEGVDPAWAEGLGVDVAASPDLAAVLPVRSQRQQLVRSTLEQLTEGDLADVRSAPDEPGHPNGEHTVLQCLHVLMNEEWQHHRYATRDLDALEDSEG